LNKIDLQTGKITRFVNDPEDPKSMSPHWIHSICEDSAGALWIGTDGGLSRLNRDTGEFTHFIVDQQNQYGLRGYAINAVFVDRAATLWIGSWGALNRFDAEQQRFTHFLKDQVVRSIYEDHRGTFWIGTNRGLHHFANIRDIQFLHEEEGSVSFKDYTIHDIYEDNIGTIWIASDHGVYRYDRRQHRFKHFAHDPDNPNSLSQDRIRSMCEDSAGALWIGTAAQGLNKYDPQTDQFQHSFPGLENKGFSPGPSKNYTISSLHMDRFGMLWIGQWIGLGRYDMKKQQFVRFVHDPKDPYSLSGNNVMSIYEDRTGAIWVGTYHDGPGGLDRFDRLRQKFDRFDLNPENTSGLGRQSGSVLSISEGNSGRLWFGTGGGGVCLFDRESESFTRFTHIPGDPNSLSHGWVDVIHEDRQGMVWAAPYCGGLNKLDPQSGQVTIYTEKDGLPNNSISSITEDDHGRLWLTTKNGLSRFDPHSETFKNFDSNDGLLNSDFGNSNVSIKGRTGEVYFGGENGIDYIQPDSIRDNPHIPPVVFTRFSRYSSGDPSGEVIIEKGVTEKQRFDLTYQDHTLTLEFAALNFRNPKKNQYAYKLEGFDDNWINLGTKHDVTFTNLDPGEYTLHVKGSNNDGIWNEEGASLVINISPPWWKTGWAYTLYVILIGLTLYGLRRFELKRAVLKSELEKSKEVDEMKSRFFANISHEFRTPLTLILGPLQKFLSTTKDTESKRDVLTMQKNARRLQQLIDQLLDLSKIEAGRMPLQAQPDDIVQRIREWTASFVSLAESRNITLDLNFPEKFVIVYFDPEKLEKITYNLLGNAFKFTPEGGKVTVAVDIPPSREQAKRSASRFIQVTVADSGVGFAPENVDHIFDRFYSTNEAMTDEQSSTGIGLALTKEFVEVHHGEIKVSSEVGQGTRFTVLLPLGKDHLKPEEIVDIPQKMDPELTPLIPPLVRGDERGVEITPTESDYQELADGQSTTKSAPALLIVEDNPDMRRFLHNCLAQNFVIVEAENGKSGYETARKKMPDLIVSDVMMPEMDGFEFCQKIKTDERTSHIPVILLTARASGESKIEGLETGADDYLTKPFDARELRVRVKNLIDQRSRLRERFRRELLIQPSEVTVTSMDEAFLKKVIAAVEVHIDDATFETDDLARESAVSRRHLNRKLRALTGQSVREFIRTIRIKRAAQLLQQQAGSVTQIAYDVGFQSLGHFAKAFRKQFGVAPSEYGQKNTEASR
jgi:signal transduction histidine kinase/ligand-binding sensor domain-containing protein/DNA-binding response OmpR family regulator